MRLLLLRAATSLMKLAIPSTSATSVPSRNALVVICALLAVCLIQLKLVPITCQPKRRRKKNENAKGTADDPAPVPAQDHALVPHDLRAASYARLLRDNVSRKINPLPNHVRSLLSAADQYPRDTVDMIGRIAPPPLRLFSKDEVMADTHWRSAKINNATSCINVALLAWALRDCPNRPMVQYVISGLRIGFCKQLCLPPSTIDSQNHGSVSLSPSQLQSDMHAELALGRRTGPHPQSLLDSLPYYRVNPIGLVPKPRGTKLRVIHDHSYPIGSSTNESILRSDFGEDFIMDRIDVVVRNVISMGKGCLMWTEDVASAYRILNVHPSHKPLQGIRLSGFDGVFFDHCLVFGSRESGFIFGYLAGLVCWYLHSIGLVYTSHYVDNYHGVVSDTPHGRGLREIALNVFNILGIPLNAKDSDFGHEVRHLGFIINTLLFTVTIPLDKREVILSLLAEVVAATSIPIKKFHSLVGKLVWASQVMPPARSYLSNLLALLRVSQQKHYRNVHLNARHRHDIAWFQRTLVQWDGVYMFDNLNWGLRHNETFVGDACPEGGGFHTSTSHYSFYQFCPNCILEANLDSQSLEMANFMISILTLGHHAFSRRLMWITDNQANVWSFAKGRSDCDFVSDCIRDVISYSVIRQIDIRLLHCARDSISAADDLSRGLEAKFLSLYTEHKFAIPIVPVRFLLIYCNEPRRFKVCFRLCPSSSPQGHE